VVHLGDGLGVAYFVKEVDRLIDAPPVDEEWLAKWHKWREEHWQFVQWVRERIAQEQQAQASTVQAVDELLQDPTRVALLRAYAAGVDPAVPYWVEHFLYFPRRRWAQQAARQLRQLGYEVEVSEGSATEGSWLVLARCQMLPTEEDIEGGGGAVARVSGGVWRRVRWVGDGCASVRVVVFDGCGFDAHLGVYSSSLARLPTLRTRWGTPLKGIGSTQRISAAGAIPVVGDLAKAGRVGKKVLQELVDGGSGQAAKQEAKNVLAGTGEEAGFRQPK
jgi:hypothetical protein